MTAKRCGVVFVVAGVLVALGLGCRGGIADTAAYQEAAQPAILGLPRLAQRAADAQFGAVGAEIKPSVVLLIQAIDTQAGYLKGLNVSASAPDLRIAHEDYLAACQTYRDTLDKLVERIEFTAVPDTKRIIREATAAYDATAAAWLEAAGVTAP